MSTTFFRSENVIFPDGIRRGILCVENGIIKEFLPMTTELPENAEFFDAGDDYILPGFIELHVHGGNDFDVNDGGVKPILEIAKVHCKHGTTTFFPTSVSCSKERMFQLFDDVREARNQNEYADIMGVHMEGPYISQTMRGAQNPTFVRDPDIKEAEEMLEYGKGVIARISSAPELPGIKELTELLHKYDVHPAIAHSFAVCEDVIAAYDMGYDIITHLYSNTPTVRKVGQVVHAGIVEAAYLLDGMNVELIGDGKHVPKELMQTVVKLKGRDRVALVTDAMRAAGTNLTKSYLGNPADNNPVIIEEGVAKLPDRSYYAGSIATQERVFKNAVLNYGFDITDVSYMLSCSPAKIMKIKDRGTLEAGKRADIVFADKNTLDIKSVFVNGNKKIFD